MAVASEKLVYMWYLNLVFRRLRCINCLDPWANIVPLFEVKSYVVVLSFYTKMIKRRTLSVFSLKHSIRKDMLFSLGQIEIILVGKGWSPASSPTLPPPLGYAPGLYIKQKVAYTRLCSTILIYKVKII